MQELRIVLTVLPVGPRGPASLTEGGERFFAVQIAAGFAEAPDAEELDGLWPWILHVVQADRIALRGWLIDDAGTPSAPFDLSAPVPPPTAFRDGLRQAVRVAYAPETVRAGLDLRWLPPEDPRAADPDHQARSFPARVQYLATLPGELALRLLATVYVAIPVDRLFTRQTGEWRPRAATLWIAPMFVGRPDPMPAGSQRQVTLNGPPVPRGGRFAVTGLDDTLPVSAEGPGTSLQGLLDAPTGPLFDLQSYRLAVTGGNRQFAEVEALLLAALDRFAEIEHLPADRLREALTIDGPPPRPLSPEAGDALLDLWRVQALARELERVIPAGVLRLAERLGVPLPDLMTTLPDRWRITAGGAPLALADRLAAVLGVAETTPRARLRQVAARAGAATVAGWLAQAFEAALAAQPASEAVRRLRERWGFPQPDIPDETEEARRRRVAEQRAALAGVVAVEIREVAEARPLLDLLERIATGDAAERLRAETAATLERRWTAGGERLGADITAALAKLDLSGAATALLLAPGAAAELTAVHLDRVWPARPDTEAPRPTLPGRGFALTLAPPAQRLAHERNMTLDGLYREVSGVALLARRGNDIADLAARPWRLVTGGVGMVGTLGDRLFRPGDVADDEWLRELLAVPLRPVFQQGVARADVEYHGQPLLTRSALSQAYSEGDAAETDMELGFATAYSFHTTGSFEGAAGVDPALVRTSRAPVLRYGDIYQFRAFLVDQAGGLPDEIARADAPWRLDPVRLETPTPAPAPAEAIPYRREVAVGEINLLPPEDDDRGRREDWPLLPGDVSLRVREWWALGHSGTDSLPVLLLRRSGRGFTSALDRAAAEVLPPAIDEHTLLRWAAPSLDTPPAEAAAARQALLDALSRLLEQRREERAARLHDPAVTALGVRVTDANAANAVTVRFQEIVQPPASGRPFEHGPVRLEIVARPEGGEVEVRQDGARIEIGLPEGTFAALEIWPLVRRDDFERRFAVAETFVDILDTRAPWPDYVAFRPSVLLTEAATDRLPAAGDLYAGLALKEQNGAVAVRFDRAVADLAFVDRFVLERERWVWRNRPLATREMLDGAASPQERLRLAASGLPDAAFDPVRRDDPASPVATWERLATLDNGFVSRGEVADRWPRHPRAVPGQAGGAAGDVLLVLDDRDGVTAADFLRYGLRVRSRYAGVLSSDRRERPAAEGTPGAERTRRRLAMGFRGVEVKSPKILAVVPLTRKLEEAPFASPTQAAPFVVLLDETAFREYGTGERLEARLALENLDLGEDPDAALPYRTGPLPDHWLRAPRPRYRGLSVRPGEDAGNPILLDVFGPFGSSLDLSPDEALSNASTFVVHPPQDVDPHWALFVRFRRVLDRPSAAQASDLSEAWPLYTLPDAALLASGGAGAGLEQLGQDNAFVSRGLTLLLDPLARRPEAAEPSASAGQYRYFLLVSRLLRGAGQAVEVELPIGLWRLRPEGPQVAPGETVLAEALGSSQSLEPGGSYRGRILEVLLNGQYAEPSPLDGELEWRAFWKELLKDLEDREEKDAAGMMRRVSGAFDVFADFV